jgi:hypothetical protein
MEEIGKKEENNIGNMPCIVDEAWDITTTGE